MNCCYIFVAYLLANIKFKYSSSVRLAPGNSANMNLDIYVALFVAVILCMHVAFQSQDSTPVAEKEKLFRDN